VPYAREHPRCDQSLCRQSGHGGGPRDMMRLDEPEAILEELAEVRVLGGRAIVEVTVAGWGRDVGRLRDFSQRSGLHVVATSGYYVEACHPPWAAGLDVDALAEALVREVTEGADGPDVRPGVPTRAVSRPGIERARA